MARRGRENFRFSALELSALAFSFTVTSALVFMLGFYVGRRVAAEHAPVGENVARVPVGAPPADSAPPRMVPPSPAAGQAAPAPPAPKSGAGSQQSSESARVSKPPTQAPGSRALTPPANVSASKGSPGSASAVPASPQSAANPPAAPAAQAAPGVAYTVQVLATRNRNDAENLTANLKKKGYGAYLVQVEDAGGIWYRVRVGHFDSSDAARRLADRASRELGLTQAYVSPISSGSR